MSARQMRARDLERCAAEVRLQIVRAMGPNKFHHFGGSLSATDLVVALYYRQMRYRPEDPEWPERDRFVLSKGHAVPALYVCLARCGFFPEKELETLKTLGSSLQGHPDMRKTCGLEVNTGSLGMGLSAANGMAMAGRSRGLDYRVYALLGDGECQEGQVWEAAMTAAHHRLDNLTVLVDRNELQAMGRTEERMSVEPLVEKWRAFGWESFEIDGHDMGEICDALDRATAVRGRPTAIVAHTVKGKGIPFMEGQTPYHNVVVSEEQFAEATAALEATLESLGG
jgi:transketolase